LRATFSRNSFWPALRKMRRELCLLAAVHVWWLALIATPFLVGTPVAGVAAALLLGLLPFAVMSLKCRSVHLGIYSVTAWNVYAAGLWPGLASRRVDPAAWIDSTVIRDPAAIDRRAAVA
jgi:hypothetical protein